MKKPTNTPYPPTIPNTLNAARIRITRSSNRDPAQNATPTKKPATSTKQTRHSDRIQAKTGKRNGKLTVQQRTDRASTYIRLTEGNDRQSLKHFLSDRQNQGEARRKQLLADAKRLVQGFALREQGRPRFFGGIESELSFKDQINSLACNNRDRSNIAVNEVLAKVRETVVSETNPSHPLALPSKTTLWRMKKKVLKRGSPHTKTNARFVAEQSQRNFVSFAALLGAVHSASGTGKGLSPELVISQDFTRLVVGEDAKAIQWLPSDWTEVGNLPTGVCRTEKRVVAVSVQATLMADGGSAPFWIYIKAPSMKDGERKIIQLKRCGASMGLGEVSYLVVDNKRKVC